MTTDFHCKYFAYELTRSRSPEDDERLTQSMLNAAINLMPHQFDAALFALRSLDFRGAILADEVGLGKTVEAGLVMGQL